MLKKELLDMLRPVTEEERQLLCGSSEIDRSLYMAGGGQVINSRKLLGEGKLITLRPHTRFVRFPAHTHDYIEVVYMAAGTTTHRINGETVTLGEGELLFLGQNAKQEVLPAGEQDIAVNFIILPEFFDNTLLHLLEGEETPLSRFITDCLTDSSRTAGYLHFEVADVLPVQNLIENLIFTLLHKLPNKRKTNQLTMGLLFLQLLSYTNRLTDQAKGERVVTEVLRYIEEHYRGGSLTEAAAQLHYDFYWLSREIKHRTGKTYTELVQEKRLSQAAFLLKNTDMKITDIALQIGYDNISYFYRLCRREWGISPRTYRRTGTAAADEKYANKDIF